MLMQINPRLSITMYDDVTATDEDYKGYKVGFRIRKSIT